MKILITGTQGLAKSLGDAYTDHTVQLVSRSTGFDINHIENWGSEFLDHDCVFNCAYDNFAQVRVLEFFYNRWKNNPSKRIVSIGSRTISHKRIDSDSEYWPYRLHKQALQQAHDAMLLTALCDIKIVNPGPIDTAMIQHQKCSKLNPEDLAQQIKSIATNPLLKRVDLWL
jgi:hypothetical protein